MRILDLKETGHLEIPELKQLQGAERMSKEEIIKKAKLALISVIQQASETLQNIEVNPEAALN